MVAADEMPDVAIADAVGISVRTLHRWKREPEFAALVGDHIGQIQASMLKFAIAKKHKRIEVLDRMHSNLLTIIDERATHYADLDAELAAQEATKRDMKRVASQMFGGTEETVVPPGGRTGLVVRQLKQVGSGMSAKTVEEFAVDVGTIKEIRGLHEQAAKELGQWVDKTEIGGQVSVVRIVGADVESI
jgi:hypothetical protein